MAAVRAYVLSALARAVDSNELNLAVRTTLHNHELRPALRWGSESWWERSAATTASF